MRCVRSLLAAALLAALTVPAAAGEIHVPDNVPTAGACNVYPWGSGGEWRFQAIVPTTMMGSRAVRISDLGFASCYSGTFTATNCEIRLAHLTQAHTTSFQTNLEKDVTQVFNGALTFPYVANQWANVGLTSSFDYNGVDTLVVEIRFTGGAGGNSFHRGTNIPRIWASGSGAFSATTATGSDLIGALKMRFTAVDVVLVGSGAPRPGGTVNLDLFSSSDPGLPYQVGSSLGIGPIVLGTRQIDLSVDDLLVVTVGGWLPAVFTGYSGLLDTSGKGRATIHIPNDARLIGARIHSAFVTLDAGAPLGLRSISNQFPFTIQ
ncbi:MAG: hypothetical protein JXQ29_04465 [Planctomycetes bacterium]|nr:hypothetical protein [Planctomycetota bacterium]